MQILITGGAGFIGSAVVRQFMLDGESTIVNVDKLTYAGNPDSLAEVTGSRRYVFEHADICDPDALNRIFREHRPRAVINLAAESHVDRSIDGSGVFIETNIVGTYHLLESARCYFNSLAGKQAREFRFLHVSTDEVFGELSAGDRPFHEASPYAPNSPYAASKAASNHLARAWHRTYGLPVLIANCCNSFGPYQFPEKLIPHMILNAISGRQLPLYGDGRQIRDWLYVTDHARALALILSRGGVGETYNVGGHNERTNLEVVGRVCEVLDESIEPPPGMRSFRDLIGFVADRPGHDRRYAIDAAKLTRKLGWRPSVSFETGIRATVRWYLENRGWWQPLVDGGYRLQRLGRSEE